MALRLKETTSGEAITITSNISMAESSQLDSQNVMIGQLKSVIK